MQNLVFGSLTFPVLRSTEYRRPDGGILAITPKDINRVAKFIEEDEEGCWLFTGSQSEGYGKIHLSGSYVSPARLVFSAIYGALGRDEYLTPECGKSACCLPSHLRKQSYE